MISKTDLSGKFAYDTKGLDQLRSSSRQDSPEALKGTAQQFEALFLNMVMKSMRDATPHESPFSSEQEKMLTGMLDQQLSQTMAKRGVGLADTLVLQLSKTMSAKPAADTSKVVGGTPPAGDNGLAAAKGAATSPAALNAEGAVAAGPAAASNPVGTVSNAQNNARMHAGNAAWASNHVSNPGTAAPASLTGTAHAVNAAGSGNALNINSFANADNGTTGAASVSTPAVSRAPAGQMSPQAAARQAVLNGQAPASLLEARAAWAAAGKAIAASGQQNGNAMGISGTGSAAAAQAGTLDVNAVLAQQQSRIAQLADELANASGDESGFKPFLPGRLGNQAALYLDNKNLDRAMKIDPDAGKLSNADYDALAFASGKRQSEHVRAFQQKVGHHAEAASRETGIPAKFMLGQAALESGWGKREIIAADGSKSHNLFGIKATPGWKGKTVDAITTEYVNGVPQARREKFRVYDSYAEGFRDYARLLTKNPRYENVISRSQDASSFAKGLQRAGYATDPHYATKLTRIINQNLI